MTLPFIVGEVSKNWHDGTDADTRLLSQMFETLVNTNATRGYRLHSFQIHRLMTSDVSMNETIIAVFERAPS